MRALKQRYACKPVQRMTIAAGLIHTQGVILCTDTQIETVGIKTQGPKMGHFAYPGGEVAFAMAGSLPFALSAIQRCKRKVANMAEGDDIRRKIESTLCAEYERIVFRHPLYLSAPSAISYWFLIAVYSQNDGIRLYATHENTMHEVRVHECLGIGGDLAQYILGTPIRDYLSEHEAIFAASQMLAKVKDHVPSCGGKSQFISLRNDGTVELVDPFPYDRLAQYSGIYETMAKSLMEACTDIGISDDDLEAHIANLRGIAQQMRANWKASSQDRWMQRMMGYGPLNRSGPQDQQSPTPDLSRQQPSQE